MRRTTVCGSTTTRGRRRRPRRRHQPPARAGRRREWRRRRRGRAGGAVSVPGTSLDAALEQALDAFARRDRVLVAVDFDGTLAPIVLDPDDARALPPAVEAIATLLTLPRTHLAVVSGRPLEQLRRLLAPPDGVALVGSHGAEIDGHDGVLATTSGACSSASATPWRRSSRHIPARSSRRSRRGWCCTPGAPGTGPRRVPSLPRSRGRRAGRVCTRSTASRSSSWRSPTYQGHGAAPPAGRARADRRRGALRRRRHHRRARVRRARRRRGRRHGQGGRGPTDARYRVADPGELAHLLVLLARLRAGVSPQDGA